MVINFDVVIESDNYSVDMSSGSKTLLGASEVTKQIAESLLTENVPQKLNPTGSVRTRLKRSFKGSYGQTFSLEFDDPELKKKFNLIGKDTFAELMSYFINEALYQDRPDLSNKAEQILGNLIKVEKKLIEQLRKSSLIHLHSVSSHFGKDVKLHYYKNSTTKTTVANITRKSSYALKPKTDNKTINIIASITRFNINTGNGRLSIDGDKETVAFGFTGKYKDVEQTFKKKLSTNLDENNGIPNDQRETLTLRAHTLILNDQSIIKYLIEGDLDN